VGSLKTLLALEVAFPNISAHQSNFLADLDANAYNHRRGYTRKSYQTPFQA